MVRIILFTISIIALLNTRLSAELIEFAAGSSNNLVIPAGTSVQINGVSTKGDAAPYIKFIVTNAEATYEINEIATLTGLYLNGPVSIKANPVNVTPYNNIPYKLTTLYNGILKDTTGNGQFTQFIDSYQIVNSDGTSFYANPEYQTYLDWKNAGNTPLPADAYTGNNIAGSGALLDITRYANQPFKTMILSNNTTNILVVQAGKKIICVNAPISSGLTTLAGIGRDGIITNDSIDPVGLSVKVRGYNLPTNEIDGPEQLTISYRSYSVLGAGGSANSTSGSQSGPPIGVFAYYYAGESTTPVSDSYVNNLITKIASTSGNFGLVTKDELNTALTQSRTDGINSVISNPNLWTLYTTSQIQNMAMGNLVLNKNTNGAFSLNYDIEQSTDLQTWTPYQALSLPLTGLPTNKAFVRIKLKNSQ